MTLSVETKMWVAKANEAIESGDPRAVSAFEAETGMKPSMVAMLHKSGQTISLEQSLQRHMNAMKMFEASAIVYSPEQKAVIECQDQKVVVNAFAGTGKTTTAEGYANARPDERILYVCLNKANQQEAQARFPSNVVCRTSHSLAYAAIGPCSAQPQALRLPAQARGERLHRATPS